MAAEERVCGCKCVLRLCCMGVATLSFAAKVVVSVYAWFGDPGGLSLSSPLPSALEPHLLPISPAVWTHALWLLLFAWEGVWLVWAWLLLCRRHTPHTVWFGFYLAFVLACLLHMGCVFALGRLQLEVTFALVSLLAVTLVLCVGLLTVYLYYIRSWLKDYYPVSLWLTRLLVLNSTVAYATFTVIWSLLVLSAVLTVHAGLHPETASSIFLSLLSSLTLSYFMLENCILDRFLRCVFAVYPVVLWVLAGTLAEAWGNEDRTNLRNQLFSLVLACVVGALILLRVVLWCIYVHARHLPDYERDEPETIPLSSAV